MKRTLWIVVLAVLVVAASQGVVADEHAGPPAYITVHYDRIDPAQVAAFEANSRAWVEAFEESGMGAEWTWTGYSGPDFTYAWVAPMPDFAYLDGADARWKAVGEALGEETLGELMKQPGALRHYSEVLKVRPDLSYLPHGPAPPSSGVAHLDVHHVRPGKEKAFEELVKKVVAAYEQTESSVSFFGHQVYFGNGSYAFVTFAESLGAFYSGDNTGSVLTEAYGAEEAQAMFARWGELISGYETSDWQLRPNLSYSGVPAMDDSSMDDSDMEDSDMEDGAE